LFRGLADVLRFVFGEVRLLDRCYVGLWCGGLLVVVFRVLHGLFRVGEVGLRFVA